jgi:hypothetical protein
MHPESGMDWLRSHALALPLLVKGRAEKDLRVGSVLRKTAWSAWTFDQWLRPARGLAL